MISKSHFESNDPSIKWRLSFSLVEKEIFLNILYIFRKAYLYCKTLTSEWKEKYEINSYLLKTVFLRTYEEKWQQKKKVFTENDTLQMLVNIFVHLNKCCEEKMSPCI